MSVKMISNKDGILKFTVDGINPAIANALRRIIMSEIQTIAINEINVVENNSALFNEVLAHRLGMIPLVYDDKVAEAAFVLKKEGPCTVYSGDLVPADKNIKPLYDNVPIVKLLENQRVDLEATAVRGTGDDHAKWQSAIASYSYDKDKFTFTVESISGIESGEVFKKALDILEEKTKELEEAL